MLEKIWTKSNFSCSITLVTIERKSDLPYILIEELRFTLDFFYISWQAIIYIFETNKT